MACLVIIKTIYQDSPNDSNNHLRTIRCRFYWLNIPNVNQHEVCEPVYNVENSSRYQDFCCIDIQLMLNQAYSPWPHYIYQGNIESCMLAFRSANFNK
jgi:hypothetical protein